MSDNRYKLNENEAKALAGIINLYLAEETADYNLLRKTYTQEGNVPALLSVVDTYVEYLSIVEDELEDALIGLKKTKIQLSEQSNKFKIRFLERLYNKEEE